MNFLRSAWRRLLREKRYALVCILSLTLGISGSILISLYLYSELTFDHYHANYKRIYRVSTEISGTRIEQSGFEIGPLITDNYPQYLDHVRFRDADEKRFEFGNNTADWDDVYLVDSSIFDIFTFDIVSGDTITALTDPYSIAISESMAEFYFGMQDAVGQTLSTDRFEFRVTLVFEDLPENVSQRYDALLPFDLLDVYRPEMPENFGDRFISNFATYFYVAEEFDPSTIAAISESLFTDYIAEGFGQITGSNGNLFLTHNLRELGELHFGYQAIAAEEVGNIMNLYIAAAVVIALLLSSCINYVNLATARVANRAREVATRKLVGANAGQLILQFVAESMFFVGIAFVVGILVSIIIIQLGAMENFTGKTELGELMLVPAAVPVLLLAWLMLGVLSGLYPAVKLSQPTMLTLMSARHQPRHVLPLRELLVWLQMTVAIAIIASVFIMLRQGNFLLQAPLGFEKENRLVVRIQGGDVIQAREALMNELRQHNEITDVVETSGAIGRSLSISILEVEKGNGESENLTINSFNGGPGYLQTLQIELIEGEIERLYQGGDEFFPILINESLARAAEWDAPVGRVIGRNEVVGVVRDFHYMPLHQQIGSLMLNPFNDGFLESLTPSQFNRASMDIIIATTGSDQTAVREYIREAVDKFSDQPVIDVVSMDEVWNENYDDDSRIIRVVAVFAGLCIIIALLGLGGMAAYNNQRRSKEVAIRKVLGASQTHILVLLSTGMVKALALAVIPACVGAWYLSGVWLQRFAYRIEPTAAPFVLAVLIVGLCCAGVMLGQIWRVAHENPVQSIKNE